MRLIEVLERDEHGLARILDGLDAIDADDDAGGGGEVLDLRDLAKPDTEGT